MEIKWYDSKEQTDQWEIKSEIKFLVKNWQWKQNSKPMESSKSSFNREVYNNTIPPQETRKPWIDNLFLHVKQLEKEELKNPQSWQKERNHKDQSRNNDQEIKETVVKINKTKSCFLEKINKTGKFLRQSSRKQKGREDSDQKNQKRTKRC